MLYWGAFLIVSENDNKHKLLDIQLTVEPLSFLVVDMDGSLLKSDSLMESIIALLKLDPLKIYSAFCKYQVSKQEFKCYLSPYLLRTNWKLAIPYNQNVLDIIKSARDSGARIILATGSCSSTAHEVYKNIGLFDELIASDSSLNCIGSTKQEAIENLIGKSKFSYIGNSFDDVPIWLACSKGYIVRNRLSFLRLPKDLASKLISIPATNGLPMLNLMRAFRVHQWTKNSLLFVPLLAAHKFSDLNIIIPAMLALVSFSLASSGIYIINDIFDIFDDRLHPSKRHRPIPSGDLAIGSAFILAFVLIFSSLIVGTSIGFPFVSTILIYLLSTGFYSLVVKKITLIDVFFLAGFYTLRVIAGGFAFNIPLSSWLLSFTLFFFLSLAFAKRFQELKRNINKPHEHRTGRGYIPEDLQVLAMLGCGSGVISVSIFALYLQSEQGFRIYQYLDFLWPLCILMFYWISRVWLLAYRGELPDDPVIFALKDKQSYLLAVIALAFMYASL